MPISNRMSTLERYLYRKINRPTKGWVLVDGTLLMRDTTTGEVFPVPAALFIRCVQQTKDERIARVGNPELGDPDRWDEVDVDRLGELCGYMWAHIGFMKRYHGAIMVRKRGLLEKVNGEYRYNIR